MATWNDGFTRKPAHFAPGARILTEEEAGQTWAALGNPIPWDVDMTPVVAVPGRCVGKVHKGLNEEDRPFAVALTMAPGTEAPTFATCVTCLPAAIGAGLAVKDATQYAHKYATRRSDNGWVLGVVGPKYERYTHLDMEAAHDALVAAGFLGESMGTVDEGARVWAQYRLGGGRDLVIPGDDAPTYPFLNFTTAHDGSGSVQWRGGDLRMQCANQWSHLTHNGGLIMRMRHTSSLAVLKVQAMKATTALTDRHDRYVHAMTALTEVGTDQATRRRYVDTFLPMPEDPSDRQVTTVTQARDGILSTLQSRTTAAHKDNAYGLLMATTEWLDWGRARIGDRNRNVLLGGSDKKKREAVDLLTDMLDRPDVHKVLTTA